MRDKKGKATTHTAVGNEVGETCEKKRPYIVGTRRVAKGHDRIAVTSHQVPSRTAPSRGHEPGCNECERRAHERIAELLGKKR